MVQAICSYAKAKEKLAQNEEDAVAGVATDWLRRFQSINQSIIVKAELRECPSAWQGVLLSQPLSLSLSPVQLSECPRPSVIRIFQLTFFSFSHIPAIRFAAVWFLLMEHPEHHFCAYETITFCQPFDAGAIVYRYFLAKR